MMKEPVDLSLTSAGYIEVIPESATSWLFDFDSYAGTFKELAPFDTSCRPHPVFVSATEFVAIGCRGSSDRLDLGGFNMRGEQVWQQNFTDTHAFPNFSFAPAAGRFAFSRNIVAAGSGITVDFAPSSFTTQQVRVYQSYNGKQLLQLEASPVQRSGQNYDLSADGLRFAIIRGDTVEIYRLSALTAADEVAIKAAAELQPEDAHVAVNLVSHLKSPAAAGKSANVVSAMAAQPDAPAAASSVTTSAPVVTQLVAPPATQLGDVQPTDDAPRKPPTLYTLPTDKPTDKPLFNPH